MIISTRGRTPCGLCWIWQSCKNTEIPPWNISIAGSFLSIFGKETIEIPPKRSAEHPNRKTLKSLSDFSVSFDLVGVTGLEPTAS